MKVDRVYCFYHVSAEVLPIQCFCEFLVCYQMFVLLRI